jgi:nitrate/nitrite transport system substrate-binding protein
MRNFFRTRRRVRGAGDFPHGHFHSSPQATRGRRGRVALEACSILRCAPAPGRRARTRPEKTEVKIGFIPLTDCASVVIASVMKFDEKYGIKIVPTKEASWAAVRDRSSTASSTPACALRPHLRVQMGIGGPKKDMAS